MQLPELSEVWRRNFGDFEPVAHLLRDRFHDRWVRFHSLPDSKRYPESADEVAIVLERHNRLIDRLTNGERSLTLLGTECSASPSPSRTELADEGVCKAEEAWCSVAMHELSQDWEEPTYWHLFASALQWRPGMLDSVLRLVSQDKAVNLMLLAPRGWLYHPYDGGADVILPSEEQRTLLASEFSPWLSRHPLGL
jgi:hypothetical protein